MSILRYEIVRNIDASRLFLSEPPTGESPHRVLLLSQVMNKALKDGPWKDKLEKKRLAGTLKADLDDFVTGEMMRVSLGGQELNGEDFKRLQNVHEVWEFKSYSKRSIRVFGRFAGPSVFIATHWEWRDKLDGLDSSQFKHEISKCVSCWDSLFTTLTPHVGVTIHDYINNAEEAKKFYR